MLSRKGLSKIMIFFGIVIICLSPLPPPSLSLLLFGLALLLGGGLFYVGESIDYKNPRKETGEE